MLAEGKLFYKQRGCGMLSDGSQSPRKVTAFVTRGRLPAASLRAAMRRHYISSSVIRWYRLDPETGALEIEFTSGSQYRYADIPKATLEGLEAAPSKGRFFDAHIRERFQTERLR